MTYETNYLAHFGIPGMKWGIRRYQNEDGTLTPEGRERYNAGDPEVVKAVDESNAKREQQKSFKRHMTWAQQNTFNSLNKKYQQKLLDKMSSGKDFNTACKELNREAGLKSAGVTLAVLYALPSTRPYVKAAGKMISSFGKAAFRSVKNSNAVKRGAMWINKMKRTSGMKRNGGVVLGKKDFDIRDTPFGFLKG